MSDHKIQAIADSAWLKVIQYLITGIMIPMFLWFAGNLLTEVKDIKTQLGSYQVDRATTQLRLLEMERYKTDTERQLRDITLAIQRLQIEQGLKERPNTPAR